MRYLIIFFIIYLTLNGNATEVASNYLPFNKDKTFKLINAVVYAYNANISQTDNTPNITASGYNINTNKSKVIANNCLPFGTLVNINDIFYIVLDRMNSRYGCNDFDILMDSYDEAINFGKQNLTIKIYANR